MSLIWHPTTVMLRVNRVWSPVHHFNACENQLGAHVLTLLSRANKRIFRLVRSTSAALQRIASPFTATWATEHHMQRSSYVSSAWTKAGLFHRRATSLNSEVNADKISALIAWSGQRILVFTCHLNTIHSVAGCMFHRITFLSPCTSVHCKQADATRKAESARYHSVTMGFSISITSCFVGKPS